MSDEHPVAPSNISLNQEQLDDLAKLLARHVPRGNIAWLATTTLGPEIVQKAGNDVGDIDIFALKIVQALNDANRISDAVRLLYQQGHRNSWLILGLNRILADERLGDDAAMQAFVNEYEPFLSSKVIQDYLPKILRTVCAVALGTPTNAIVGSGFLIAPDLVITNYHVIAPFLTKDPLTNEIKANGPGNQMFFFFDYLSAPAPNVPPSPVDAVTAAEDWLVYARQLLVRDGKADSPKEVTNKEYDYAVIRLARPMGNRSARSGGGGRRGWLSLPKEKPDYLSTNRRIIVFQHPGKAPQQFDIGDFIQLDPTTTRVWYSVSTAHGSSGGAAVDSEGQLFALHNAEVEAGVAVFNGRRVNQGIRIDIIADDLAAEAPEVLNSPPQTDDTRLFWSLNDNVQDSRPVIGRAKFRKLVEDMMAPESERVLVVKGPPMSGLQFSIKLLQHILGAQTPVAIFSPTMLSTLEPQIFLRTLVQELGVSGLSGHPMPEPPSTENIPRWLRQDLPKWLSERLSADELQNRTKYPAWVVINTVVNEGQPPMLWADNLRDFVSALAGARSSDQTVIDLPQLRWLFLALPSTSLPLNDVKKLEENLENYDTYEEDFAKCLQLARHSIDKNANEQDDDTLQGMARFINQMNQMTANPLPLRKVLANGVREIIRRDVKTGD